MRPLATVLLAASVFGFASVAQAACADPGVEFVAVQFDPERPLSRVQSERVRLERRIVEHLRAEFRPQHIEVCVIGPDPPTPALATLQIERDSSNEAFVRARANDAVTQKELSRRLSLDGLPQDAHALAIALGASELLLASWVELRLENRPQPERPIPKGVERAVESSEEPNRSSGGLGLELAAESFSGGLKQAGVNAKLSIELGQGVHAVLRVGGRSAMSAVSSTHGTVSADGWLTSLAGEIQLLEPAPNFRLNLQMRVDVQRVGFTGNASRAALATSAAGLTSWGATGLGFDVRMSRTVVLDAGILAGYVIVPVVAADAGEKVLGVSKGLVAANAGIKIPF